MLQLKSSYFRTREELCDFVNGESVTVVQIVANSTGFVLFYKEGE